MGWVVWCVVRQAQGRFYGGRGDDGMCPLCQANVSSSGPDVSSFRPNVSTLAGEVWSEEGEKGGRRRASALGMRAWMG